MQDALQENIPERRKKGKAIEWFGGLLLSFWVLRSCKNEPVFQKTEWCWPLTYTWYHQMNPWKNLTGITNQRSDPNRHIELCYKRIGIIVHNVTVKLPNLFFLNFCINIQQIKSLFFMDYFSYLRSISVYLAFCRLIWLDFIITGRSHLRPRNQNLWVGRVIRQQWTTGKWKIISPKYALSFFC